jgi:hypothetical protein
MLVGVSTVNNSLEVVSSVTYNGVALQLVGADDRDDDARIEIWKLVAPPTGTHNVVVTFDANLDREGIAGVMTFTGVDPNNPLGAFVSEDEDTLSQLDPAEVDVPSATNNIVFAVAACETCNSLTSSNTARWEIEPNSYTVGAGATAAGAASVNMSWTLGAADHWVAGGVSVRGLPSGGGGGGCGGGGGTDTYYILSRDSDTQVTIQEAASTTATDETYTIERAYNTFQAWEDGQSGDLVTDDRFEVGVAYDDGDFTAGAAISGSTTDSTHYMKITVAEGQRHDGTAGTGVTVDAIAVTGDVFAIEDEYTVVEWLELRNFDGGVNSDGFVVDDVNPGTGSLLQNLIIHNYDAAENGIRVQSDATVRNSILYDGDDGVDAENGAALTLENVTIYGMVDDGFNAAANAGTLTARNVISVGNGGQDFEINGPITYFGHNMYSTVLGFDPASYQGSNAVPPASLDDLFVTITPGSEDLHLEASGHTALGTGLDLSASFAADIDGDVRTAGICSGWDLGADESPGSGSVCHFAISHDGTGINCEPATRPTAGSRTTPGRLLSRPRPLTATGP